MNLERVNFGSIWTVIAGTAMAVVYMFSTFVTAAEFSQFSVEVYYGQYYARLTDFTKAVDDENEDLADEFSKQLERLKAKICEEDPEWERCHEDA